VRIVVYGTPAPQGSKRFVGMHGGHATMVESSKKVKPWRQDVRAAAIEAWSGPFPIPMAPLDGPLVVRMVFTIVRPRGHYRTGKNANQLRADAPARPCVTPDLSKLARSTEDALTEAGLWRDDSRVVEYSRLAKVYANEDPDALASPGAVIDVCRLSEVSA
jgi:Holliday junction resolvase RusA-like endonuclease